MGLGELGTMGALGAVWIAVYIGLLYVIVFYIALPAISIIAKMFGFPGMT